jgi:CelD/BcsL family acetyltransferase involved in cellulose biosynthesis
LVLGKAVADIIEFAAERRASRQDATTAPARSKPASTHDGALLPLTTIDETEWRALSERAIEPNAYYLPDWELAVNASAPGRTGASTLAAWSEARLIGLMPVISLSRAYRIPLPALVSAHPYGTLCTPSLDRANADDAASQLLQAAREASAHALILREVALDGATMKAFTNASRDNGLAPRILNSHVRACLDATREADALLREALGPKKLKELRRLQHRLAEHGAVSFEVARSPREISSEIETFLTLEASGWKGKRGTALMQVEGDATFIRRATTALAERGQCEIVTLRAGETPVASGIVLRHQSRAFFFKLGVDERFAKFSPGVQLTLELTRHLCADETIASADSTASPDHPMINPIWRGRFAIGDVLIPLRTNDPVVTMIHAALVARQLARDLARRAVQVVRSLQSR